MSTVFLDTSGLIAALNTRDQWHEPANAIWDELLQRSTLMVTTSLVLIELADGLARREFRQRAVDLRERLLRSKQVEVIRATTFHEERGWDLYRSRSDKRWGMTDCISIVVLQEKGINRVFTADRHFEQAGFKILLK